MSKILVHTSDFDAGPLVACLPNAEGVPVRSLRELADHLVDDRDVRVVIIQAPRTDELGRFLAALKRSFPRLDVVVVTSHDGERVPEGILRLDGRMSMPELSAVFRGVCGIIEREQRDKARFDWPLRGQLSLDGERWERLSVRSLSASGAFLEREEPPAAAGTPAELRLEFQDAHLRTSCEILEARPQSSTLPRGFGVRFIGLPGALARTLDALVRDALLTALLRTDVEPVVPALAAADPVSGSR